MAFDTLAAPQALRTKPRASSWIRRSRWRDPSAWPILVHCHGCMDRSPAWMGIYKFVVKERPLLEVMQEIERHRGYRPKASVILLYNRVLSDRGGARYQADPTATLLRQCAGGTTVAAVATRRAAVVE